MSEESKSLGQYFKYWRNLRGLSQLELAERADTSMRHLSFIETGRGHPSAEMLLRLANELDIPLRSRNTLLARAGYAPLYRETGLTSPEMSQVRKTLEFLLKATEPYPAMLIDRHWNVLSANDPLVYYFKTFVSDRSFFDPGEFNLARVVLHPRGLQPAIQNWREFESFMVGRVRRMVDLDPRDSKMIEVLEEITHYDTSSLDRSRQDTTSIPQIIMPLHVKNDSYDVKLFTTIATLGAPHDITLQEIRIEAGFPMDEDSDRFFRERPVEESGKLPDR